MGKAHYAKLKRSRITLDLNKLFNCDVNWLEPVVNVVTVIVFRIAVTRNHLQIVTVQCWVNGHRCAKAGLASIIDIRLDLSDVWTSSWLNQLPFYFTASRSIKQDDVVVWLTQALVSNVPTGNLNLLASYLEVIKVGLVLVKGLGCKPIIHVIAVPVSIIGITGNYLNLVTTSHRRCERNVNAKARITGSVYVRVNPRNV